MKTTRIAILIVSMVISSLMGNFFVDLLPEESDSFLSVNLVHSNEDSVVIEFELPGFFYDTFTVENILWEKISIMTYSSEADSVGLPALPKVTVSCHIPEGASVTLTTSSLDDTILNNYDVYPLQFEFDTLGDFYYDSLGYDGDIYCDDPIVEHSVGVWRKLNYYTFDYYPIEYRTDGDSLIITRKARVKLAFSGGVPGGIEADRFFKTAYETALINFNEVGQGGRSASAESKGKILIVTPDSLYDTAEKLADWRQREGYWVKLTSTDDIDGGSPNWIDSTVLYDYLHEMNSAETLSYVVLIGRQENIPWHDCTWLIDGVFVPHRDAISDLSYCYSDTSGFPEFFLGRIPLTNNEIVGGYIDSIVEFETTMFDTVGNSMYNRILITAGLGSGEWDDPRFRFYQKVQSSGFLDTLLTTFSSEDIEYLAEDYWYVSPERDDDPNKTNIKDRLTDTGVFFVSNFSHGSSAAWFMNGISGSFGSTDILPNPSIASGDDTLYVNGRLSFARGYSCWTAYWDCDPYPDWGLGTAWTRQIGLGYFGETTYQFWGNEYEFFRKEAELIAHGDIYSWGQLYNALISYCYQLTDSTNWEDSSFALAKQFIGDPGVHVYRKNDSLPNDPYNIELTINTKSICGSSDYEVFYACSASNAKSCTVFVDTTVESSIYNSRNALICISDSFVDSNTVHCEEIEWVGGDGFAVFDTSELPDIPASCDELILTNVTFTSNGFITKTIDFYVGQNDTCENMESVVLELGEYWNLFSIPVNIIDTRILGDLITEETGRVGEIYKYYYSSDEYESVTDSEYISGEGYWVYCDHDTSVMLCGFTTENWSGTLITGLNMIGSVYDTLRLQGNFEPGSLLVDSTRIWYWDASIGNYRDTTCIIPTWGYWAIAQCGGSYTFPDSDVACSGGDSRTTGFEEIAYDFKNPPGVDDTGSIYCTISSDTITVTEWGTSNVIENCMVWIETESGATIEIGYTDSDGKYGNSLLDINDTTFILLYRPGYRKYLIHPYGLIDSTISLQCDVKLFGDLIVQAPDTIKARAGSRIYLRPLASSWDYGNNLYSSRCEVLADSGHIVVSGNSDSMVYFIPDTGGRGDYQWGGIWARYCGSIVMDWATIEYANGVGLTSDPKYLKLKNTRHIGDQEVSVDHKELYLCMGEERIQLDSCYIEGRVVIEGMSDSCWINACSLKASGRLRYECIDVAMGSSDTLLIDNCVLFNYTERGIRNYVNGYLRCVNTVFDGDSATAVMQYYTLLLDTCRISGGQAGYNITEADGKKSFTKSRWTIFDDYVTAGAYILGYNNDVGPSDFGTVSDSGFNCFLEDSVAGIEFDNSETSDTVFAQWNYFDTLLFTGDGASRVIADSTEDSCRADPSMSKVFLPDRKPYKPEEFTLFNAVPNPFNSSVTIEFELPKSSNVSIEVFNIIGTNVISLVDEELSAGRYRLIWDGKDCSGRTVSSGTYLYRMRSDDFNETKKMTFIR